MEIALDANILGRLTDSVAASHGETMQALQFLWVEGHDLCIVPQVLAEFASFASRPLNANGFGFPWDLIDHHLDWLETMFDLRFPDPSAEYHLLRQLLKATAPTGRKVHDIKLVASCGACGLSTLLTYNTPDFSRPEQLGFVRTLTPGQVIASAGKI